MIKKVKDPKAKKSNTKKTKEHASMKAKEDHDQGDQRV